MDTAPEEWRDVPSLPQLQASSWGRVRLKPHIVAMPRGGHKIVQGNPTYGCLVRTKTGRPSRMSFRIYKTATVSVHRAVCEAFHGEAPPDKPLVIHIDEDPTNNRPENLAWGTPKENLNAPGFLAYCRSRVGTNSAVVVGRLRKINATNINP